jgi:hypothetical protein
MFISRDEMFRDKELGNKIKQWSAALNAAAKSADSKVFNLNGPAALMVRLRQAGRGLMGHNFMGGEAFRLSAVTVDRRMDLDGISIAVILNPADLSLASEFSSLTLPLDRAMEHFSELEEWTRVNLIDTDTKLKEKEHMKKIESSIPTVAETRASTEWGAW